MVPHFHRSREREGQSSTPTSCICTGSGKTHFASRPAGSPARAQCRAGQRGRHCTEGRAARSTRIPCPATSQASHAGAPSSSHCIPVRGLRGLCPPWHCPLLAPASVRLESEDSGTASETRSCHPTAGLAAPEAPRSPGSRGGSVCAEASLRVSPGWAVMLSLRVGISSMGSCCWAPRAVGQGAWLRHPKQGEKTGHMGKKVMGEFMKRDGIQGPCSWNENQGVYDGHRLPGGACVWPGGRAPHRSLPSHVCLR